MITLTGTGLPTIAEVSLNPRPESRLPGQRPAPIENSPRHTFAQDLPHRNPNQSPQNQSDPKQPRKPDPMQRVSETPFLEHTQGTLRQAAASTKLVTRN